MLVASINYQLNLGYVLTFLLAGAGVVSMHLTHNTLRGLTLHLRPAAPVFAGDAGDAGGGADQPRRPAPRDLRCTSRTAAAASRSFITVDVPAAGQEITHLSLVPPRRGWHEVPTLVVETALPVRPVPRLDAVAARRCACWPGRSPSSRPPALPPASALPGGGSAPQRSAGGELDGVRFYRRGDSMRQVVWKKVARSGELVSRETSGSASQELWLDWAQHAGRRRRAPPVAAERLGAAGRPQRPRPGACACPATNCRRARATASAAPRWTCWRPGDAGACTARWAHLPRDARDTLFQLVVIGWTLLPHAVPPAGLVRAAVGRDPGLARPAGADQRRAARALDGGGRAGAGGRADLVVRAHAARQGGRRHDAGGADGAEDAGAARAARRAGGVLPRLLPGADATSCIRRACWWRCRCWSACGAC